MTNALVRGLNSLLEQHAGPKVRGHGGVWRVDGDSAEIRRCKLEILCEICRQAQPYVHYDEAPDDGARSWAAFEVAPLTWRLSAEAPGAEVLSWLSMGNWQLYVSHAPIDVFPDLCRATDDGVESFVDRSGVTVVIDSFHDDEYWVIGLRRDPEPGSS